MDLTWFTLLEETMSVRIWTDTNQHPNNVKKVFYRRPSGTRGRWKCRGPSSQALGTLQQAVKSIIFIFDDPVRVEFVPTWS